MDTLTSVKDLLFTLLLKVGVASSFAALLARWNTFSRVKVSYEDVGVPIIYGPSPTMPPFIASQRILDIDSSAGTLMYRFDGDLSKLDFLRYDITNLAYAIRQQGRSAVIGVGAPW